MTEADFALMERTQGVSVETKTGTQEAQPTFERSRATSKAASEAVSQLVETTADSEPEVYEGISKAGQRFLSGFVQDKNLEDLLLLPEDIQQLAAGVARLRGPIVGNEMRRDYTAIVTALLSHEGTVRTVGAEFFQDTSIQNAHNMLRAIVAKCKKAAPNGVTLDTLLELGDPEYEPKVTPQAAKALGGTAGLAVAVQPHAAPKAEVLKSVPLLISGPIIQKHEEDYPSDEPLAWQVDALCAQTDPEAFFPDKGGSTRSAKKICTSCEVKNICLRYALGNDERFGIWGGLSERERRKLKKQTNAA